ncbi:mitochondrial matrix Mmp37-domain-containing protein [Bisporella sp. PMI_857]|nr:mitochondrial matrix Mmp37-domain-containing protein [Bisporella sp. PMI_857]
MASLRPLHSRFLGLHAHSIAMLRSCAQLQHGRVQGSALGRRAAQIQYMNYSQFTEGPQNEKDTPDSASSKSSDPSHPTISPSPSTSSSTETISSVLSNWEDTYTSANQLPPVTEFGMNQHMRINDAFKKVLQTIPWEFDAVPYVFAYGSGVFPQSSSNGPKSSSAISVHSNPPDAVVEAQGGNPKMIDFIFGVTHTQHFHSLNLRRHRDHYSALGALGSGAVSRVQDNYGAGVYYNTYINCRGLLIKYGVVNIDTLCQDLSEWQTLYIAGRLQKPVKILRDHPKVRLANQINLISALRTALLLLPPSFTEKELYGTIASISYLGDPRMSLPAEDPSKVANIVGNNIPNFRRLYSPLIDGLPNVQFNDSKTSDPYWFSDPTANVRLVQDMDPIKRGNMVRRLPKAFRSKLYFQYQSKYQIPQLEFNKMMENSADEQGNKIRRREGGEFERRIASEPPEDLGNVVRGVIKKTIAWPSASQSVKGLVTAGFAKSWRYANEKRDKYFAAKQKEKQKALEDTEGPAATEQSPSDKVAEKVDTSKQSEEDGGSTTRGVEKTL